MSLINVFIEYILQWCDTHHFSFKNVWTKKKRKEKMCEQAFKIMWKCSLPIWNFTSFLSELIFQFFVPHYVSAFSSVQSLSHVQLFVTPWTAAHQASLSFTNSQSLLKFMSVESVIPSNHLILCHPLLLLPFPASGSFPMSGLFASGGQNNGASASASVLPMNIQDDFL